MRTCTALFSISLCAMLTAGACAGAEDTDPNDSEGGDLDADTDADGDTDSDGDTDTDYDPVTGCDAAERLGGFMILLADDYTGFSGSVLDGVTPSNVPEVIATEDTCSLLGPRPLFCDPACTALGETCGPEGGCIPAPSKQDVGTVTVTGMKTEVSVEANPITSDYFMNIQDPYPAFDPVDRLTVTASGGYYEGFVLEGTGSSPITTPLDTVTVEREAPVVVTWEAANVPNTQIHVMLDVNVHGARTGWIECDAPDTGSFEIPEALVTLLIELGLSGYPKIELRRQSVDKTAVGEGCVELNIYSQKILEVLIPGLDSCGTDDDCDDGQICDIDLVCR